MPAASRNTKRRSARSTDARHPASHRGLSRRRVARPRSRLSTARSIRATSTTRCPKFAHEARPRCRWPISPARAGSIQRRRRRAGLSGAEDLRRALRRVPRAAHLQAARHDQHALHDPARPIRTARSSRPSTRATTTARFTRQTGRRGVQVQ